MGSLAAILAYGAIGWAVLARAGQLGSGSGSGVLRVDTWVIAGYFLVGAAGNLASRSRDERLVMTPFCVVLCALTVVVAAQG